jgi:hypothetical protein
MKPPLLRLLPLMTLVGGVAAGHWLWPSAALGTSATVEERKPVATGAASSPAAAASTRKAPAWDGTIAGLLQLAKDIREYRRTLVLLHLTLEPLPAEKIGELTAAFPWRPSLSDYENNVMNALLDQWAAKDAEAALRWAAGLPRHRSRQVRTQILQTLAALEADKAISLARRITPVADRDQMLRDLVYYIATRDPERAFDLLQADTSRMGSHLYSTVLSQWAQDDPAGAFAKACALRPNEGRNDATRSVIHAWARTDPAAARAAVLSLPAGTQRQQLLNSVFEGWASHDPRAAHTAALALTSEKERQVALHSTITAWAITDPAAAVQVAGSLPLDAKSRNLLQQVYGAWASQDPAAAAASAVSSTMPKQQRNNLLSQVASTWANNDPQAAMNWARSLPAKDGGTQAVSSVMWSYARTDGPSAAALWQTLPNEQRRGNLQNLMYGWSGNAPDAALRFARSLERPQDRVTALTTAVSMLDFDKPDVINSVLNELPAGPARVDAIRGIFTNQSQHDSTRAVRWLQSLPENDRTAVLSGHNYWEFDNYLPAEDMKSLLESTPGLIGNTSLWSNTASSLANDDPAATLAWAQNVESPAARRQAIQSALQTWSNEDPAAALAHARSLNDPDLIKDTLPGLFQNWAQQDTDAVLAFAETATGEEREAALLQGTLAKADNDPVASAEAVDAMLAAKLGEKPGAALNNAANQVAQSLFRQDIPQATAWALQLPHGSAQDSAVTAIVQNWTRLDPVAASQWVQQFPAGDTRDTAAQQLSQGIQQSDPESAFVWASSIASESKREEAIRSVAQTWIWQDRNAARAAIENAPVSENVRTALLEQISKRE